MNRREILKGLGATAGLTLLQGATKAAASPPPAASFTYCLNMATIRGHNLGFAKEIAIASKAGFHSVEIWMDSLQAYLDKGASLKDVKKQLDDMGVVAENCIGFAPWILDDEEKRKKGLEQLKKEMDVLAEIGCKRIAAPPAGATDGPLLDLRLVGERFRAILELGDKTGVVPHLELWGFSKNLGKLSEVMYVALESGHPSARVLLDIFHLYKGGSGIDTLGLVNPSAVEILHLNDYPANLSKTDIKDSDRIFPGDGIAPVTRTLKTLRHTGKPLIISVEVFNKNYYQQDALLVAQSALAKMKAITKAV